MDKGRQIDNRQNVNARWIDQFNQTNKTSVKTRNPPGGKSSFSLGWSEPEPIQQKKNSVYRNENDQNNDNCVNLDNKGVRNFNILNKPMNNFDNIVIFLSFVKKF